MSTNQPKQLHRQQQISTVQTTKITALKLTSIWTELFKNSFSFMKILILPQKEELSIPPVPGVFVNVFLEEMLQSFATHTPFTIDCKLKSLTPQSIEFHRA